MTIQTKATEQYFPVVLFISLCKVVLAFESVYENLFCESIQMTVTVDEVLKCNHSKKKAIEQ